jgi:hypothetical protein
MNAQPGLLSPKWQLSANAENGYYSEEFNFYAIKAFTLCFLDPLAAETNSLVYPLYSIGASMAHNISSAQYSRLRAWPLTSLSKPISTNFFT